MTGASSRPRVAAEGHGFQPLGPEFRHDAADRAVMCLPGGQAVPTLDARIPFQLEAAGEPVAPAPP
jgi:hypothetical protein